MPATTFIGHFLGPDTHANRPAATGVPNGTLYVCTTDNKIERVVSGAWADYATLGSTSSGVLTINSQSASYTLVLTDAGKIVSISNAGANTLTVPTNASAAFSIGTTILVRQAGAGQTTVTAAGGVTVNSRGTALKLAGQYAYATLVKTGTDTWELTGDITT
jgi:hypothetical protein